MPLISDNFHNNKLKEFGINIKTKYIVGNKIFERNTDNSVNDDIVSGIRCEKDYYIETKNMQIFSDTEVYDCDEYYRLGPESIFEWIKQNGGIEKAEV